MFWLRLLKGILYGILIINNSDSGNDEGVPLENNSLEKQHVLQWMKTYRPKRLSYEGAQLEDNSLEKQHILQRMKTYRPKRLSYEGAQLEDNSLEKQHILQRMKTYRPRLSR